MSSSRPLQSAQQASEDLSPSPSPPPLTTTNLKPSQIQNNIHHHQEKVYGDFGHPSKVIDTVTFKDHIIVSGNDSNLIMFISELRRPSVRGSTYHPILIVHPSIPTKWESIKGRFNDVYLLVGTLTRSMVFNRVNISDAFAVILLASGTIVSSVSLIFTYLSIHFILL